jgi:hypothetical protein
LRGPILPTLIRLIVALLFLGALGFAGLFALTIIVDPGQKQIVVKIPQSQLVLTPVAPKPVAPVVDAATLPPTDDSKAKEVDTSE